MLIGGRDTIGNARIKNFAVSLFFPAASLFPLFDPRGKSINGQRNVSSPISIETKDIYEHVSRMRKDRCVKPSRPRSRFLIWRASTESWGRPANNRIINRNISQPRDHLPRLGILFESSEIVPSEIRKRSHNSWNAPIPAYISSAQSFSLLPSNSKRNFSRFRYFEDIFFASQLFFFLSINLWNL